MNDGGEGTASNVTATPETVPDAPTSLTATGADTSVTLSWTASVSDGGRQILKHQYRQKAGTDNYGNWTDIPESAHGGDNAIGHTVTGLDRGKTYTFEVWAVNSVGNSASVEASAPTAPAAPANLSAAPGDGQAALTWDDPGNTTITKYQLMQLAENSGLIASDGALNDRFGVSVAVDDDTAVVGAFQPTYTDPDTSLDVSRPGAAYVYTKDSNGAWSQQAKLTASAGADGDEFGISVAVDGDTVVVGARGTVSKTGAIYVFTKPSDGDWTSTITETKLTATGGAADDLFGASVALYGGTIVVGAPGAGSAYVFTKNSGVWSQAANLTASNAETGDEFGISVAVDDDTIAVGAYGKDGNSLADSGLVYVFVKPEADGGWANASTETVQLRASDRAANANFGRSVAVDGGTIVVGASGDRNTVGGAEVSTGSAYVFTEPSNGWADGSVVTETAKLTASDGADSDQFGRSVAVDGNTIVVGAHQNDDDGTDSGSIYVFIKPTNGWTDTTGTVKLTAANAATGDRFGIALALDGDTALVAAPRNDANDDDDDTGNDVLDAGSAYVFEIKGWTDVPENDANNRFHAVTGLTNDITYTFKVRAVNPSGDGPASTVTGVPVPVPAAPVNLSATPGDGEVALSWDDLGNATIIKYQYSTDGGENFTDIPGSNAATTSYTVTGLAHSTEYTLALRAVNPTGNGEASTVTALILPAKPTGLTGIEYNSQVELGWDDPDDSTITKYQLLQVTPRKLTAGGAGRDGDFFGMAVAADGDTALVGALQAYDADFNNRPGAAYVFTWNSVSEVWTKNATLNASDGDNGDGFGRSVALDGDTAVVGAYQYDEGEPGEGQATNTGSAYIFTKDSQGMWKQTAQLTASDAADGDQFGYSVAVDGDTIVVGAHLDDDGGAESGSVYVFTKPSGDNGWNDWNSLSADGKAMLTTKLTAPGAAAGGYFGNSVAIDGNTIVVGARKTDSAYAITKPSSDANDDGSIDWEDWDSLDADGKATLTATLTAFDAAAGDEFGISVAIDGVTVVVGAHQHDKSDTVNNSGAAYVFTKPGNAWATGTETAKLTASDGTSGDEFGISVAVSGNTVVIGAHLDDDKGDKSGSAYFFTKPINGNWATGTETAKIIDHDGAAEDHFGWSVAVDGSIAVVGAYGDGSNKGAAHIMGIPSWTDISNSAPGEANATSYAVTGLTNDVVYTFQLRAVNVSGHSPASDTLDATPKAVPHAPANLSAAGGNGQVALSWDDPDDTTITGYQYQQAEGEGEFGDWADISGSMATTTSHTVTGLTNGTSYTFAVRAVNDSLGNGAASTVTAVMVPTAPTGLSAAPGDAEVALSWHDPDNDTIDEYQYSTDGGANFSDFDGGRNSDATANTVASLTNYTAYSFQIRAINETGAGPASNSASATPRAPKPAKPAGLTAVAGDTRVTLRWDDPDNDTITGYQISEVIPEDFLTATGGAAGDHFGISVAIDGNTAVVGADRANNKTGSAYIFTRDSNGNWIQQAKLDGEETGDQFGWSVAVDGDTVVVGAHAHDFEDASNTTWTNSGATYVFTKPATDANSDGSIDWKDWNSLDANGRAGLTVKLTPTVPEAYAFFGGSVALDGNTLAIGSRLYDAGGRLGAGAAYVFTKDSGTGVWSQAAKLTASIPRQLAALGYSLAVDGDTVLVGAYGDDTVLGELGSGSAYVFDKPSGGWTDGNETAKLTASDRQPSGYFGFSVALDGDTAVIGARQHNDPITGAGSGAAYVFTKQSGVWGEKAKLTPSDAAAHDNFGVSVAVDGDTVVVGSWQDDDNGRNSGSAYVFEKPALGWARTFETLKLTAPNGAVNDRFGWSVAVDLDDQRGDLALVGAYSDDIATGMDAGSVHVLGIPDWMDIGLSDHQTTNHTVTSLTNGTEYAYQIRALNRSGAGPASDGASDTPLGKPVAPVLSAQAGDGQVTLSWTAATADATRAPVTRYEYNTDGGTTFISIPDSGPSTDNYTVLGLTNLTTYTFAVRAVNVIGEGPSATKDATPASATPAEPANLLPNAGDTQVRLTWDDPDDSSIDKYQYSTDREANYANIDLDAIDYSEADKFRYTVTVTSLIEGTSLSNGTLYTFHVRAVDFGADPKESLPAKIAATPTSATPLAPANLTADPGDSRVTLVWDNPDDVSIDKYQYRINGAAQYTDIDLGNIYYPEADKFGYTVTMQSDNTDLTNGNTYTFEVRAVDNEATIKEGDPSGISAKPLPDKPAAPTGLKAVPGSRKVDLNWNDPNNPTITRYEVKRFLNDSTLTAPGGMEDDKFGYSVAVDGDTAVIGAYQDDDNGQDSGAAYIFTRSAGVWSQAAKLTASDGEAYDNFGISVAVDGDTVVIGASGDDGNGADSGSAYVFTKANGVWSQAAKLTASDGAALDYFGYSVAVSGDTVLVGAYQDDREETLTETGLEDSGSAYIFIKPDGGWADWDESGDNGDTEAAKLTATDAADDDYFGISVALHDDTAAIGAPGHDEDGVDSGAIYVFVRPSDGWAGWSALDATGKESLTTRLTAGDDDGETGDSLGISVALDGDTLVVGAYLDDREDDVRTTDVDETAIDSGSAYVFTRDASGEWGKQAKLAAEDGEAEDWFGYSVAVDGDTVVVGAFGDDDNGEDSGSAYVFARDSSGRWSQTNRLTPEERMAGDRFGYSVAVHTESYTALVGAGSAHVLDIHDWEEIPNSDSDTTTYTVPGLINSREYNFLVRAVNLAEAGPEAQDRAIPGAVRTRRIVEPDPPYFDEGIGTIRAVSENVEMGTAVGDPVKATSPDNRQLQYSLWGTDSESFAVNDATGQITTGVLLDYEIQDEYSVRVRVRDTGGQVDAIDVAIHVEDLEPPLAPGGPEVISAGPASLAIYWMEPDNRELEIIGYDLRYREVGGEFLYIGYNDIATSLVLGGLRSGTGYEVQVLAVNIEGASPWSESGFGETEQPAPTLTPTPTPTPTPGARPTPTATPTATPTPGDTPTPGGTPTPDGTSTPGGTSTPDGTSTPIPLVTPPPTPEVTSIPTAMPTPGQAATPMPGFAGAPVPTPTMEPVALPTAPPMGTSTVTPEPAVPPVPGSSAGAAAAAPTPSDATVPVPSVADDGDGGFPWWIIVAAVAAVVVVVVIIVWARRRWEWEWE